MPFKKNFLQNALLLEAHAAIGSVTQPYLLCLSGLPAWSAFPEEQIFLSCACWISSCLCHLPLPLPHSSVAASPWQQPHPAAWLIMENKTVNPKPFFILFILMLILTEFNPQLPWEGLIVTEMIGTTHRITLHAPVRPRGVLQGHKCTRIPTGSPHTWGYALCYLSRTVKTIGFLTTNDILWYTHIYHLMSCRLLGK